MSRDTLLFFKHLLSTVTLNVGADDFEEVAEKVLTARRELDDALEDVE